MKLIISRAFIIAVTTLLACSKDKNDDPPTRMELLTERPWMHILSYKTINNVTEEVPYNAYPWCYRDNQYHFLGDSTFVISEGETKCVVGDPDIVNGGRFVLEMGESNIRFKWDQNTATLFEIVKLTADSMIIKDPGTTVYNTNVYIHP